jgi:hypothetical protein
VADSETPKQPDFEQVAAVIVAETNAFREEQGLKPVEANDELLDAAGYFADYMARTDKYSHTADGKAPSERAVEHGYDYCLVSENIAYVYSSAGFSSEELAEKMVEGWKESPEHRKNMLEPAVTEVGVALAHSGRSGNFYGVQMFGRPKSLTIAFSIENQSEVAIKYAIGERKYELTSRYSYTHEECLPADLTFELPGESNSERVTYRPQNGDQFIVSGPADELTAKKK